MTKESGSSPENTDLEETQSAETGGEGQSGSDANSSADSSGAEVAKKPVSMLDAVKAVLPEKGAASTAVKEGEVGTDKEGDKTTAKDGVVKSTTTPVPDESLPFHKHPRFQEVLKQANEGKAYKQQLEVLRPEAEETRQVRTFMADNGLAPQEVAKGFEIMALMKNDPVKAYELLAGYAQSLQATIGETLPADLQKKVDDGVLDIDAAKEVSRARFQTNFQQQRSEQQIQQAQQTVAQTAQQRAAEDYQRNAQAQAEGVMGWEASIKKTDPDYAKKEPFILAEAQRLSRENPPKNQSDAVGIVELAHKNVTANLTRILPARRSVAPVNGGSPSSTDRPKPKTLREVVASAAAGES